MSENKAPKEIDVLELFRIIANSVKRGIYNIIKLIIFMILFAVRNIHFLIGFILIGVACGFLLYKATARYYSTDLIAESNGIHAADMVKTINDLDVFAEHRNYKAMAIALQLPDSVTQKIKHLKSFYYIDLNLDNLADEIDFTNTFDASDTTQQIHDKRIYLELEVYDNHIIQKVKESLFSYINNNPYLIKLCELRKKELNELILLTQLEINKLDSLQNTDYFKRGSELQLLQNNNLMILSEKEQQMYYINKLELLQKKQNYLKELEFSASPISIVKDFTPLTIAENPKGKYIFRYGFWFSFLGYFGLMLFKNWKRLKNFIE